MCRPEPGGPPLFVDECEEPLLELLEFLSVDYDLAKPSFDSSVGGSDARVSDVTVSTSISVGSSKGCDVDDFFWSRIVDDVGKFYSLLVGIIAYAITF